MRTIKYQSILLIAVFADACIYLMVAMVSAVKLQNDHSERIPKQTRKDRYWNSSNKKRKKGQIPRARCEREKFAGLENRPRTSRVCNKGSRGSAEEPETRKIAHKDTHINFIPTKIPPSLVLHLEKMKNNSAQL